MTVFASAEAFGAYLDGLGQFRMQLGLERMRAALRNLGLDAPPFALLRVVGTNGKGSVSRMLAGLAASHGLKAGLYTSPHLLSPKERVMVLDREGARMPSDAAWLELAESVYAAGPTAPLEAVRAEQDGNDEARRKELQGLTYFEFLTAMAVLHFAREKVDLAVLESGLGARYDATAAFGPELACITSIGLDHQNILGPDLASIAAEKAHVLKQGAAVVLSAPQHPGAWLELEKAALESGTPLLPLEQVPAPPFAIGEHLGLFGAFQESNARLALACWQTWASRHGVEVNRERCRSALEQTRLPGRMQRVSGDADTAPLLLDGAHNEDGLLALEKALQAAGVRPRVCVAGFMADKDLGRMLPVLLRCVDGPLIFPELSGIPRAAKAGDLVARATELGGDAREARDLSQALELAQDMARQARTKRGQDAPPVLICGSLYLLGEFFKLRPELLNFS